MATSTATTSTGAPIPKYGLTASQTAGPQGPMVLQDFIYLDHLQHFDRERIPERVVHAKGAGAFGYFEVTNTKITEYCKAKMFSQLGKRTPVGVRFSRVRGESGSADTERDPRGFAIKFYTEDGNWDLVCNNTPIFFIRDPILFPAFIHSQKRHPATGLHDNHMMWDFFSLRQESIHQVSFLFGDRGAPDGYRFLHGYGSNTFTNVNDKGETTYVKYHIKSNQGIRNLSVVDSVRLAGVDADYAQRDLYQAIASGDFPSWTMFVQLMTPEQAVELEFNAFDVTKIWPHGRFPLIEVGKLVLNRNPKNYFAEVEQIGFSPSHMVPGIEPSPDKMLQGRLFSYPDTLRYRLGVNFTQIPVNRSLKTPQTYQRDGHACVTDNMGGTANYYPNSDPNAPREDETQLTYSFEGDHSLVNKYPTPDEDNFTQCRVFYCKVLDSAARDRLATNIASTLRDASNEVQERALNMFAKVDEDYRDRVDLKLKQSAMQIGGGGAED